MGRIRTIKPDFWTSESMASVSDRARLLAIALLNYADDEGYFHANIALVRAACFPFDHDSWSTHGALMELSKIGYIEIRTASSGKKIGRVANFTEHQVINRPSKSKIVGIFDAASEFTEDSWSGHGGLHVGTGNREQGREQGKSIAVALPPDDDDFSLTPEEPNPKPKPKPKPKPDPSPKPYPPEFEAFWSAYPANDRGRKRGKAKSFTIWKSIPKADLPQATEAAANYAREQTEFIRDPERFLKHDWWRDWVGTAKPRVQDEPTGSYAPVVSLEARRREIEAKRRESHTESSK